MLSPPKDCMLPCGESFPNRLTSISEMETQASPKPQHPKAERHAGTVSAGPARTACPCYGNQARTGTLHVFSNSIQLC